MPETINQSRAGSNRIKVTKRSVESLPTRDQPSIWYDDRLVGFGVRVMASGRRFYFARYRNKHGRSRWFTIGEHGKVTADAARAKAQRVLQTVAVDGTDPSGEREAFRAAPTVSDLMDRYIVEHVERQNRPRTRDAVKEIVGRDLRPSFGHLKVAEVTRQDVHKFHAAQAHRPRQANLIIAVLSKAFSLAELWEMRPEGSNPCRKIERYPERHRERFLSAEELARLGAVLRRAETEGLPWKNGGRTLYRRVVTGAIDLLLYTGCRLSEVLNLRWDQIDFAAGLIKLASTKSGGPQLVTINAPARQVLKTLKAEQRGSEWVLPSVSNPKQPISKANIEDAWKKIRIAARIEDVRMHDLRHTVGTYAGQTGANAFLVRDLLRHKNLAMTGRYVNRPIARCGR